MTTNNPVRLAHSRPQCPPCTHDCHQGDLCPRYLEARVQAVVRAAKASERAKLARQLREHYRPIPWYYHVDWSGVLIIAVMLLAALSVWGLAGRWDLAAGVLR